MNILINPAEHRLRAFWRLLIQFIVAFLVINVINLVAAYLMAFGLALSGQISFATLVDLPALNIALTEVLTRLPFLLVVRNLILLGMVVGLFALLARWLDRRPLRDYGLRLNGAWWRDFIFGLALGGVLMALIFTVERAAGWVEITGRFAVTGANMPMTAAMGLVVMLASYILVGVQEELVFRGYQIRNLAEGLNRPSWGPRTAVLVAFVSTSLLFGLAHLGNNHASLTSSLYIALAGVMLGLGYVLTGELAIPIGLHISWNYFQGNVFGFPVSGGASQVSMITIQQGGPELWTGGAFGPEAGLMGVLAMLVSLVLIWGWVRLTHKQARVEPRLAVYQPHQQPQAILAEGASEPQTGSGEHKTA